MAVRLQKLWSFKGGLQLDDHKTESLQSPIAQLPVPKHLQVQLRQHIGGANEPLVSVGQRVLKGEMLALARGLVSAPVHAPTSGTVTRIEMMPVPHVSGLPARCVEIETDGRDEWIDREPYADYRALSPQGICTILHESGVVGLGGALFPTAIKLALQATVVDTLIVNAAECEPYISCDQALLAERAADLVSGIEMAKYALQARHVVIGIEDSKAESIGLLRDALKQSSEPIELTVVPTRYPSGAERQLVKLLTGKEVPAGGLPADIGIRAVSIATVYAIFRAVRLGEPLISRIVTVCGDGVVRAANLEVLIGTTMADLIAFCGGYTDAVTALTMGGPMMGFALPRDDLPVIKSTNCLIASSNKTLPVAKKEQACIRCGNCAQVCPAKLLPQQLYWYARARNLPKLEQYHLADCIECGACAHVCPSRIPLVKYYRFAKSEIREEVLNREQSESSRIRFESREARLAAIARDKQQRMAIKRVELEASKSARANKRTDPSADCDAGKTDGTKDVIAAALARVRAKKAANPNREV
jgi:electron transport complex protein RnfC